MFIIILENKESSLEGHLILSTYIGNVNITKNNTISGKYSKVNSKDSKEIDKYIKRFLGFKVDKNKFIISIEKLNAMINEKKVAVAYRENHRTYVLNSVIQIGINNISVENNKLFIVYSNKVKRVNKKYKVYRCGKYTIIIYRDTLFSLNQVIDQKNYKQVILSKRPKKQITKKELFPVLEEDIKSEICDNVEIYVILTFKNEKFYMEPRILYNGQQAISNNSKTIIANGEIYYRDFEKENEVKKGFANYEYIDSGVYAIDQKFAYIESQKMLKKGYHLILNGKKVVSSECAFNRLKINSDIDWFSIEGIIQFDKESVEISDLIGSDITPYMESPNYSIIVPDNIIKILKLMNKKGTIEKTPQNFSTIIENSAKFFNINNLKYLSSDEDIRLKLPKEIIQILYDYQVDGVIWMKRMLLKGYGICLADDMGLGKTLQLLSIITDKDIQEKYLRVLIIVPKILLGNWSVEYEKYISKYKTMFIYHGKNRGIDTSADIMLTTYGIINADFEKIKSYGWDLIIIDEAQKIKNSDSKIRKKIKILSSSSVVIASTGTPYENNLLELWSIMDIINPGMLKTLRDFNKRYIVENRLYELSEKISPFLLRRCKEDVLKELPQKIIKDIYCLMDKKQQNLYNAMLIKIKKDIMCENDLGLKKIRAINGLTFLREICCHPQLINKQEYKKCFESTKMDAVMELVNMTVQQNEKIVIFSQFTRFLKIIASNLKNNRVEYCYIDGQTPNRKRVIEEFENTHKTVLLISLKAGGFGINLTCAKKMIICDPWWNPSVERQAEDRIYRIGQKNDVTIYRLIVKNTVEEKIQDLKSNKDKIGESIFKNIKQFNELDLEHIIEVLK